MGILTVRSVELLDCFAGQSFALSGRSLTVPNSAAWELTRAREDYVAGRIDRWTFAEIVNAVCAAEEDGR